MEKRPAELTVATRQKTGKNKSTGELLVLPSRQRTTGPRAHALTKLLCLPADPSMVHRPRTPGKGHTLGIRERPSRRSPPEANRERRSKMETARLSAKSA